jgi:hypothetical protein
MNGREWIAYVSHDDGGWQFHSIESSRESDAVVIGLAEIVDLDASLAELADLPLAWRAWRVSKDSSWQRARAS